MCDGEYHVYQDEPGDPGQVVATIPLGARRDIGLYLPTFTPYLDWWQGCVYSDAVTMALRRPTLRDDRVAAGDNTSSFGWVFSELKYMCAFVLLYGGLGIDGVQMTAAKLRILRG